MKVRRQDLPGTRPRPSELKEAHRSAQLTQDATRKARRRSKRSAREAGLSSAHGVTSSKKTKLEISYKKVTITWQHEVICEITALADERAEKEFADNDEPKPSLKRKDHVLLDFTVDDTGNAGRLDPVETIMSWKKARISKDGEEKSYFTHKTSPQSPSSTTAPSSAEKMRGFIRKGEEAGFKVTANPFLEERLPESRSMTVKELPDQTGFNSGEDDSGESGDDAYQIHSPCKNEAAEIPWPEDDEEMYKLFFGDEDEDDDNADAASPSNKDLLVPGAWKVDHGVQDWLEEGEKHGEEGEKEKDQENTAADNKTYLPTTEPIFFGFAAFPGFHVDKQDQLLSATSLKGFEAAWICSNTPASSTPEDKAMADDISLDGWT